MTRHASINLRAFLMALAAICATGGVVAQADSTSSFHLKGFLDAYAAARTAAPQAWLNCRTRLRIEASQSVGKASVYASLNAVYNPLLKEESGLHLREAYLNYQAEHWSFRAGRQLMIWGNADGVRIMDLLSPMDMTEFLAQDYDDIRTPVTGFRLGFQAHSFKAECVIVPLPEPYRLPLNEPQNPWSLFGSSVTIDDSARPSFALRNTELGAKLAFALPGCDFSFSGLYTWNKMPLLKMVKTTHDNLMIRPSYYRMGVLGADLSKPVGNVVLRLEAAMNLRKPFLSRSQTEVSTRQSLNWLVGLDWYAPSDWMVSTQFTQENIFGGSSSLLQANTSALATLSVGKKLIDNTLSLNLFSYFDLSNKGWFARVNADYALTDLLHLNLGYDWIGGEGGVFALYKKNSELWCKVKYSF